MTATLDKFRQTTFASADADKKLSEVLKDQEGSFTEASNAVNAANSEVNETRTAMNFLEVALERSTTAIKNRANADAKAAEGNAERIAAIRRDEAEQVAEVASQLNRLRAVAAQIQVSGAERAGGDPFGDATTVFEASVQEFQTAVNRLLGDTTAGGGGGVAPLTQAEQQGALTEGAFGIGGGFGELRDLLKQQAESTKLLTLDNLGALLIGGVAEVNQNLIDTAIRALAERQQGVLAQQGTNVDIDTLTNQITLAVTNGFNATDFQSLLEGSLTEGQGGRVETLLEALTERAAPAQAEAQAAEQQAQATADLATTVSDSINALGATFSDAVSELFGGGDGDRSGTEISTEELENALDITKDKTEENTKAIEKATIDQVSQSETLKTSLGAATTAMVDLKQGVNVQLEATQQLDINVNLTESVDSLKQEFEAIAQKAALSVVEQALQRLASNSTDQDRQKEVNDTLESLA